MTFVTKKLVLFFEGFPYRVLKSFFHQWAKAPRQRCMRGTFWINLSIVVCISERLKRQKDQITFPSSAFNSCLCSKVSEAFRDKFRLWVVEWKVGENRRFIGLERTMFLVWDVFQDLFDPDLDPPVWQRPGSNITDTWCVRQTQIKHLSLSPPDLYNHIRFPTLSCLQSEPRVIWARHKTWCRVH